MMFMSTGLPKSFTSRRKSLLRRQDQREFNYCFSGPSGQAGEILYLSNCDECRNQPWEGSRTEFGRITGISSICEY